MKRSTIWLIVLLALAILVSPLTSTMQQAGRIPTIGELGSNAPPPEAIGGESPFWQAMRQLGWVEGQNIAVEQRYTKGHDERLPAFAAELVQRPVDVLLVNGTPAVLAATHATSTIPIVMWSAGDPVSLGLIESLGRPGGNITGVSLLATELAGKTLELLREALPGVTHVVVLTSGNPIEVHLMSAMAEAAQRLGLTLQPVEARSPDDFDVAFATITQGRAEALYVMSN